MLVPGVVLLDIATAFRTFLHATTLLEWVAVATGFACVWLAARESIWNFPVAVVSCALYIFIYHRAHLYSDRNLQGLFIGLSLYGWYAWLRGGRAGAGLAVSRTTGREWLAAAAVVVVYTLGYGYYLGDFTDATLPYIDSFTTAGSIVAQYLLTRKRLENWLLWIVVDVIYVPVLWYKELYPTSVLYALYLVLAAYGYWQWRRELAPAPIPLPTPTPPAG